MAVKKTAKKAVSKFSILKPKGMGGIHGGSGYKFQDGYIVCQIPKWLQDPNFVRFMPEGTGDVDLVFKDKKAHVYEHIQVKDHEVSVAEFKEVINTFMEIDSGTEKVYRKFILSSPSLGRGLKSLLTKLSRYTEAKPLYDEAAKKALKTAETDLQNEFKKLKLTKQQADFITRKVEFETCLPSYSDSSSCRHFFVAQLAEHPRYKQWLHDALRNTYPVILEKVSSHSGKVLNGKDIQTLIDSILKGAKGIGKSTVLYMHNWSVEKFDQKATTILDWSKYFDRTSRKVPDARTWNTKLLPELLKTREQIAKATPNRHIVYRGKAALSTGFAIGSTFPAIGNWSFEIIQPPATDAWRSDAENIKNYKLKYESIPASTLGLKSSGTDIAVIFNITGKPLDEVVESIVNNDISVKRIILVRPGKNPGNLSIGSDSEAVSLASTTKDILKEALMKYKASKTHVFYYGPFALAVLLGQKFTSVGQIQLYEYQNPGYKPSCLIKT